MINLSHIRRGMGCAACNGTCGMSGKRKRNGVGVMVCCDDEGNLYDDGSSDVLGGVAPSPIGGGDIYTTLPGSTVPGVVTVPTNTSSQNLTLLGQALQAAGAAAAPVVKLASQQAPYFIAGPNGQSVLYNPNTGAVAGAGASIFGSSSTSLSPLLLLGGLVVVAMMAAGKH
jgi:hypothetical protein